MTDPNNPHEPSGSPSFEKALAELEIIVERLEDGEIGLAESLAQYEQGVKLLKQCYQLLESAERRIELLSGQDADGNPVTTPLDDEALTLDDKARARSRRRSSGPADKTSHQAREDAQTTENNVDEPGSLF